MRKMSTTICKLLVLLLIVTISLCSCAQISSILEQFIGTTPDKDTGSENTHTHSYVEKTTAPTCVGEGYTSYTCDCGDGYVADLIPATGHSYSAVVTAPTCSAEGYTTYTCACGDSYVDDKVAATGHSYSAVVTAPTCSGEGYTTYTCACGDSYVADKTSPIGHDYQNGNCTACGSKDPNYSDEDTTNPDSFDYSKVPEYSGENYFVINNNIPYFTKDEITNKSFESYSELDSLGRVGVVFASLAKDMLPSGDKGSIGHIKPTGWIQNNYPTNIVLQTQIYNRSHMIAWAIGGNDEKENLMTGTPYFNQIGMQIFESQVLDYIRETNNHVMYRVTPVFVGNNLLANGALMEAWSVEDNGEGICFCVFVYNVQPGVIIDYATGENSLPESDDTTDKMTATLVTDISEIKAGDKIIIVAADKDYALGDKASSGNNRVAVAITKDGDTVFFGEEVVIITLGQGLSSGTFSLGTDDGFLYSASSSKNHLKTDSTLTDNGSWKIEIASNGVATIKSTGSNTRNWLRFNSQNAIFSSYESGQGNIYIYKMSE